jgi:hypothetical protein
MTKILLILLLSPLFSMAQTCKYDKNEYDKFQKVNKKEKEVKVVKTFNKGNGYLTLLLCNYGGGSFFRLSTAAYNPIVTGRGDAVVFLLDNEETVKAYPNQIYSSDYNGARNLYEGTYEFKSYSDFSKIKEHPVKSIRLFYSDVYKDFDLKRKGSENLQNAANCF